MDAELLKDIPSVDEVLRSPVVAALAGAVSRTLLAAWVREDLADLRAGAVSGRLGRGGLSEALAALPRRLADRSAALRRGPLRRVINATGVLVHTNLGRAPLASGALDAVRAAGGGYSNLEYDIEAGERGSRTVHLQAVASVLFPGSALLAVNNNAAAVLLVLNTLAEGREAIVSRGELVEIGGSFRIPDVMKKAGAVLREVGTTNRTRIGDYRGAIGEGTGLLVKVHTSNYRILGFVEETPVSEMVALGRESGIPVFVDEGSGNIPSLAEEVLGGEPSVRALLAAGAGLVSFSGDKLLGGPQAGLIVGAPDLVRRCARNPLARALRLDKMTIAALAWTLAEHAAGRAGEAVPVLEMLGRTPDEIGRRAERVAAALRAAGAGVDVSVEDGVSRVGGGAAPLRDVPTRLLVLRPLGRSVSAVESALRAGEPAIIARIEEERLLVDLRTVDPEEDDAVADALAHAVGGRP